MNKYHRHLAAVFAIVCVLTSGLAAQTTLAILDLDPKNISTVAADALGDRLRDELVVLNKFKVIARDVMMNKLLEEQSLQLSGCTSTECIVQAGNILGAEKVVGGSVSKVEGVYYVSIKIVDVETGQILKAVPYDFNGDISDLLQKGMKEIAYKLSDVAIPGDTVSTGKTLTQKPVYDQSVERKTTPFRTRNTKTLPRKVRYKLVPEFGMVFHEDLGEGKVQGSSGYGCSLDFGVGRGFTLGPEFYYAKLMAEDISTMDSSYARYHDKSSLVMFGLVGKLSLYENTTSMKTTFSLGYAKMEYNYRTEREPGLYGDEKIETKGNLYVGFGVYLELLSSSAINLYSCFDYSIIFPPGYETTYSWHETDDTNDQVKLYRLIVGISFASFN